MLYRNSDYRAVIACEKARLGYYDEPEYEEEEYEENEEEYEEEYEEE